MWRAAALALVLTVAADASLAFAQLSVKPLAAPLPDSIAAAFKPILGAEGVAVTLGATTLEFWWVHALQTSRSGAPEWGQVAEGALVGAVRVTGAFKEIRGKPLGPGVYTLRLGLQPQNGDHLGASPNREFLVLSPAAVDSDPKPLGFDGLVALSKQTLGASHPASLSLDPPISTAAPLSLVSNEMDHKGVTFEVKTSSGGALKFGLILIGIIEH